MVSVRIILAGSLSLIALTLRAADDKEKLADDALAVTKRELETMKSDRLRPGGAGPQLQVPDAFDNTLLPTTNGLQTFSSSKKKQQEELLKSKGRAKNWLADGVQKNSTRDSRDSATSQRNSTDSHRADGASDDVDGEIDPITGQPTESTNPTANPEKGVLKTDRDSRSREAKDSKESPPDNPLNRYMSDWMSSKDYALLKKTGDVGPNLRADLPSSENVSHLANESTGFSSLRSTTASLGSAPPYLDSFGATTSSHENPYLSALTAPPGVGGTAPSGMLEPSISPTSQPSSPPLPYSPPGPATDPRPASTLPENSKRSDDAKYFPQLKRF